MKRRYKIIISLIIAVSFLFFVNSNSILSEYCATMICSEGAFICEKKEIFPSLKIRCCNCSFITLKVFIIEALILILIPFTLSYLILSIPDFYRNHYKKSKKRR